MGCGTVESTKRSSEKIKMEGGGVYWYVSHFPYNNYPFATIYLNDKTRVNIQVSVWRIYISGPLNEDGRFYFYQDSNLTQSCHFELY